MRLFRILLYSFLNLIIFSLFYKWYEIIYYYFFGEKVFVPTIPLAYIFIPIAIFQVIYQLVLLYELFFKKFISKKLNWGFIVPILVALVLLNRTPYGFFKGYKTPEIKIEDTVGKIAMELEKYRVKTFYYPKSEARFKKEILSKLKKDEFLTEYRTKRKRVPLNIYYLYDKGVYTVNVNNYQAPSIIVSISGDGKKFWITALVKVGFISNNEQFLTKNGGVFIIEDDIMIRKKLRDSLK